MDALGGEMIAAIMFVVAVVVTCFGIVVIGHAGADEGSGRAEAVIVATATSRTQWFGAVMLVALGGTAWLLVVSGAGLWVGYLRGGRTDPGRRLRGCARVGPGGMGGRRAGCPDLLVAQPLDRPRLGLARLLPRRHPARRPAQVALWALDVSPYSWVPHVPAEAWSWSSFLGLAAVALALCGAAWVRFRHRDIG